MDSFAQCDATAALGERQGCNLANTTTAAEGDSSGTPAVCGKRRRDESEHSQADDTGETDAARHGPLVSAGQGLQDFTSLKRGKIDDQRSPRSEPAAAAAAAAAAAPLSVHDGTITALPEPAPEGAAAEDDAFDDEALLRMITRTSAVASDAEYSDDDAATEDDEDSADEVSEAPDELDKAFIASSDEEDSDADSIEDEDEDEADAEDSDEEDAESKPRRSKPAKSARAQREGDAARVDDDALVSEHDATGEVALIEDEARAITAGIACETVGRYSLRRRAEIKPPPDYYATIRADLLRLHADHNLPEWRRQLIEWRDEGRYVFSPGFVLRGGGGGADGARPPTLKELRAEYARGCEERGEEATETTKAALLAVMRSWVKRGWETRVDLAALTPAAARRARQGSADADDDVKREYVLACKQLRVNPYTMESLDEEQNSSDDDDDSDPDVSYSSSDETASEERTGKSGDGDGDDGAEEGGGGDAGHSSLSSAEEGCDSAEGLAEALTAPTNA